MEKKSSIFTATHGVMTAEVGVISGELELRSTCDDDGTLTLAITYVGAEEWYTLPGDDYHLHDLRDHEVVHRLLTAVLERS
ncbi:hypothetical protein ACUXCC_003694 [Cytobacillus horneckiae]|uniref:Uncharacterized protein n=1 Tax=Cytobacillus horneckiae TaxID=549687 RepID=A0A2N0ZJE6_9BACI|nr:hypothetical protein [Cytobacillus horneckiae]MBN6888731.1 hypothetical protein [Cytobacillus horneckiae]MCM3180638.1 hypothetical protein [Cytobacillus horneckiae]MEC1153986.1 hypothetical protein [Cytobacillus horneckiae]MED2938561.1 hypothetical protein [Cytobacillus horneckiae]PKG29614.1 hypothetical protein CWS20_07015 [Cytobacillus horneckiae]